MRAHGGDIYTFMEKYDKTFIGVIDFSASINPLGPPDNVVSEIKRHLRHIIHYPDPDMRRLRAKISQTLNVDPGSIVCGNGCTELIYLLPKAMKFKKVIMPAPTYGDYERACRVLMQASVTHHMLKRDESFDIRTAGLIKAIRSGEADALFLCNPNNPTGRFVEKEDLLEIAEAAKKHRMYLIVDESFIDFVGTGSVVDAVERNPYLIVLKSMTKFYALPGLRLGYGVFPMGVARAIRRHQASWSVNTLAQAAGIAALDNEDYRKMTMEVIGKQKKVLEKGFSALNAYYVPSSANYYLLRLPNAGDVKGYLENKGILVRDCSNFKGLDHTYIRVAVKSSGQNKNLLKHMGECIG
ncbi:MAG: Threonine-phosphate decarboxylase [Syntrophorhabdus sp. PtaU1.Bin058]|nr:MAG: Threonine-phosphate decarboxylase [Syntrophorhabdus sp. PtaU1.Bin058]